MTQPTKKHAKQDNHSKSPAPHNAGATVKSTMPAFLHAEGKAEAQGKTAPAVTMASRTVSPVGNPAKAYGNTAALIASPTVGDVYVITIVNKKVGGQKAPEKPPTVYLNTPDGSSVSTITPQTRLPQGLPSLDKLLGGLIPAGMIPKGAIPEEAAPYGAVLAGKPVDGTKAGSSGGIPDENGTKAIGNSALDIGSPTIGDLYVISIVNTKTSEGVADDRK
ncbi:MAG: hypothetical protein ABFC24_09715 [Methanoregulaceae archaeon]